MHAKDDPSKCSASLQEQISKTKDKRESLSQESKLCYVQMRLKRPQFISSL
jgi:hypothetical protein